MNILAPIAIVLVLLAGIGFQQWRLERAQEKASEWKTAVSQYEQADEKNQKAIKECEAIAKRNKAEATRQSVRVDEATERIKTLRERLEERLEAMDDESLHERVQGDCPAAHDPEFVNSLYERP